MQIKTITVRGNPSKKGRQLVQWTAQLVAEAMGIPWTDVRAPYLVLFEARNPAGNHYHDDKYELISIARGTARITLEDIDTKERASITVSSDPALDLPTGVVVPVRVAHVAEPLTNDATLLVWATHPARRLQDDFDYPIL